MVERMDDMKLILLRMKKETLNEINKAIKSGSDKPTGETRGDIHDQASSERDREPNLILGDREREKLHNINEALLKIQEGEYGICEECEEEIPIGRLRIVPFGRYCSECMADIEKKQAQTKRIEEDGV
jgi:DnaK suppressor protein